MEQNSVATQCNLLDAQLLEPSLSLDDSFAEPEAIHDTSFSIGQEENTTE